jgi:hypothetical protein
LTHSDTSKLLKNSTIDLRLCLFVVVIASTSVAAEHAQYVHGSPAYGRDLEGVWEFSMLTPLQRPANYRDQRDLSADEAAVFARSLRQANTERQQQATRAGVISVGVDEEIWFERGSLASINGRFPTSLIVEPPDGQLPALTAQAAARVAERRRLSARLYSAQDRALNERCLRAVSGPPYLPSSDANTLRIVQSPDDVALTVEKFDETRIVSLRRQRHVSSVIRTWVGDAIGHWDGNTLVVDTVNFTPEIALTGNYDDDLHLRERFTRIDRDTLLYEATIEDATAFVRPWAVALPMNKLAAPLYEFACHESNYSMRNMLSGARTEEGVRRGP